MSVTCSLGYSVYPQDGADATTLLKRADAAMYGAKEDGGNGVRRYTPELSSHTGEQLEIETQLKQALQRGELPALADLNGSASVLLVSRSDIRTSRSASSKFALWINSVRDHIGRHE
ncbi:diguanylate cyclase domain-containing protein [Caballeronia sp. DA-9]|uniref:diguanylate cyclase domain-containing protein n=1 Tax=Caballeronia sp. DA-9 TaxID=3436237 RepID=UPI003F6636C0